MFTLPWQGLLRDVKAADAQFGLFNWYLAKCGFAGTVYQAAKRALRLRQQVRWAVLIGMR